MESGGNCGYRNNKGVNVNGSTPSTFFMVIPPDHLSTYFSAEPADPFHTLPVRLSHNSQLLLRHFQKHHMVVRGLVKRNSGDGIFCLAISDAAILHVSLELSARHWIRIGGQNGITSSMIYYHKVEALRIVNERMNDLNEAIRGTTIGAVACLTILEVASKLFCSSIPDYDS
jgi:hypothetical protein